MTAARWETDLSSSGNGRAEARPRHFRRARCVIATAMVLAAVGAMWPAAAVAADRLASAETWAATGLSAQSLNGTWDLHRSDSADIATLAGTWSTATVPANLWQSAEDYTWYRRQVFVPAEWQGRHVFLSFGGVKFVSEVYVNGSHVGGHYGGWEPFELDVTGACTFGQDNELHVRVQDVRGVIEGEVPYEPGQNMVESVTGRVLAPVGSQPQHTGIWQGVALAPRADVYIEDVTIVTSVRQDRIEATYLVRNLGQADQQVDLSAAVLDGQTVALDMGAASPTVPAGGTAEVTLTAPWTDPQLWMPDSPHLYHLESVLTLGGRRLDTDRTRFGFREFWIDGIYFVLNGVRMKFLASAGHPPWRGDLLSDEEVRARFEELRGANVMAFRLHANIWPENWYKVADEIGMPIIQESAIWCFSENYALAKSEFWQNARDHWSQVIARDKNRPSIVMYSIENEILHCRGEEYAPGTEVNLAELGRYVKSLDPTRPIMYDGDGDPDGAADVVNLHYPHECTSNTLYPDTAYWLDKPTVVEGWPYALWEWDRTKPLYMGEFLWVPASSAHPLSLFTGDGAYPDFNAALRSTKALVWEMQVEAYRAAEVSGMCPWTLYESGTFPNEQYYAVQRSYEPNAAIVKEYDRRFFSGEQVERTVFLYNDTLAPADLVLRWDVDGAVQGEQAFTLQPAERIQTGITLAMPAVATKTDVSFGITVLNGGAEAYTATRTYGVFPSGPPQFDLPPEFAVALYPGDGTALAFLQSGGVDPTVLTDLANLDAATTDALIIGAHALDPFARSGAAPAVGGSAFETVADFVQQGGTVVVLEQDAFPAGMVPASLKGEAATIAFKRAGLTDLLADVAEDGFKFWRGDNVVTRNALSRPTGGGFRVLVDSGGPDGLTLAPLLEAFHGQGRYVMSQLLLCEKLGAEPMANLMLERLVNYAAEPMPARQTVGLVDGPQDLAADLETVGVEFVDLSGTLASADLSGYELLMLDARSGEVTDEQAKVRQFVLDGGGAVLHGLNEAGAAALSGTLPEGLVVQPSIHVPVIVADRTDEVTDGLTSEDLHWIFDPSGDWRTRHPLSTEVLQGQVLREPPPLEERTVMEVEDMIILDPGAGQWAGGEFCFFRNGSVEAQIHLPQTGEYFFGVVGRGTPVAGVYPDIAVHVDGAVAGYMGVGGPDTVTAFTTGEAEAGTHTVRFSFINDTWDPDTGEDRNVWLDKCFYAESVPGPEESLLQPPGLVKVPDGDGFWLIDEVSWEGRTASYAPAARYLCGLLTNLGAVFPGQQGISVPASSLEPVGEVRIFNVQGDAAFVGTNGTIGADVDFLQDGAYAFTVVARGTICAGQYPNVRLHLDGDLIGERQLQAAGWKALSFTAAVTAGVHQVQVEFTNDHWDPDAGEDRNLWVQAVRIRLE